MNEKIKKIKLSIAKREKEFGFCAYKESPLYVKHVAEKVATLIAESAATFEEIDKIFELSKQLMIIATSLNFRAEDE